MIWSFDTTLILSAILLAALFLISLARNKIAQLFSTYPKYASLMAIILAIILLVLALLPIIALLWMKVGNTH